MKLFSGSLPLLPSVLGKLLFAFLAICVVSAPAWSGEAEREKILLHTNGRPVSEGQQQGSLDILSFTLETQDSRAEIHSGLKLDNTAGIKAQLRDGATMVLTCTVRLERVRTLLTNVPVSETIHEYYLRHDPLTREFILSGPDVPTIRQKSFDTLVRTLEDLRFVLPLKEPLVTGDTYQVHFDLTLQHAEVPPWLSQALFFWSWDVVSPVSVTQEFVF